MLLFGGYDLLGGFAIIRRKEASSRIVDAESNQVASCKKEQVPSYGIGASSKK